LLSTFTTHTLIHSFCLPILLPPRYTLFPYTTLFRSSFLTSALKKISQQAHPDSFVIVDTFGCASPEAFGKLESVYDYERIWMSLDRKSTRLNSSHGSISYAVFCLKKKNRLTECRTIARIKSQEPSATKCTS